MLDMAVMHSDSVVLILFDFGCAVQALFSLSFSCCSFLVIVRYLISVTSSEHAPSFFLSYQSILVRQSTSVYLSWHVLLFILLDAPFCEWSGIWFLSWHLNTVILLSYPFILFHLPTLLKLVSSNWLESLYDCHMHKQYHLLSTSSEHVFQEHDWDIFTSVCVCVFRLFKGI